MKQETTQLESTAELASEPVEVLRLGKDEMNLAEFPIALLADRVPKGKRVMQFEDRIFDEKTCKYIPRKLTISSDEIHGLPTAVDDDVILGLIQLTKLINDFSSRDVEFNRLDLIRLLGWPDSGDSYRRLGTSLKRWLSVTLLYENAWRDNKQGAWITKGFHILDNIELNNGRKMGVQGELFPSRITWNKVVFESFKSGYLKTIDYGLYVQLKHPIARRMYRFLSKRMYFGPKMTFDLCDLAFAHIGLSDTYRGNAGKIKEKLQPGIEELEAVKFLEPMTKDVRYRKIGKDWEIRLNCRAVAPALPATEPGKTAPPLLVKQLTDRKVTAKTAAELVQLHPADFIQAKIEVFDWMVERKDKRLSKNPAGYLVKSITDDYTAPPEFTSKADLDRLAEQNRQQQKATAEKEARKRAQAAGERSLAKAVDARIKQLDPAERAALEARLIAESGPDNDQAVQNSDFAVTMRLLMLRDHFSDLLRNEQSEPA